MTETTTVETRTVAHRIRSGPIEAVIWETATPQGIVHAVTVTRRDQAGSGVRETCEFGRNDLLVVARVLDDAHTWILRSAILVGHAESRPAC